MSNFSSSSSTTKLDTDDPDDPEDLMRDISNYVSHISDSSIEKLEYTKELANFVRYKKPDDLISILKADPYIEIKYDKDAEDLIADIFDNVRNGNIYIIHNRYEKLYKNNESDTEFKKDLNGLITQLSKIGMLIPYRPPIQATKPIDSTSNNNPKSWFNKGTSWFNKGTSWFNKRKSSSRGGKKTKSKKNKSKKNKSKKNKTRRNRK